MPWTAETADPTRPAAVGDPGNLLLQQRIVDRLAEMKAANLATMNDVATGPGGGGTPVVGESPLLAYNEVLKTPLISKRMDVIIGTKNSIGLSTIYVPWLIRVPDAVYAQFPQYGRWRCYTSTDHDSGRGGIAIGISSLADPLDASGWTWLRNNGSAIMFSEGSSSQVETPCVVWNPLTNLFHMYYQTQTGSGASLLQFTRVATSADGITNWAVVGDAIPSPPSSIAGFNHRGYARVYYLDGLWAAWHLQGGATAVSAYGWSFSNDGLSFVADRRRTGAALQMTDGVKRLGISSLVQWRGEVWAVGSQSEFTSGAATSNTLNVWTAPINLVDDLRSLRGRPKLMPWPLISPETSVSGPPTSWATMNDGRLVGAMRINGENGALAMAVMSA